MQRLLIFSLLILCVNYLPVRADEPDETPEEIVSEYSVTEIKILSDAEMYYIDNDLHYPLEDAEEITDYQALADSAASVLNLFPDDFYALQCRSTANYFLGRKKKAVQDALFAYCLSGGNSDNLDVVYGVAAEDPDLVIGKVKDFIADSPLKGDKYLYSSECSALLYPVLATLYQNNARMREAYDAINKAIGLTDDEMNLDNILQQTTILLRSGHPDMVLPLLKPYADDEYYSYPLHNYLLALRDTGRSRQAFKIFRKLIEDNPDDEELKINYATMLAANDKYKEAADILDTIILKRENKPNEFLEENNMTDLILIEALVRRGMIRIVSGQTEQGRQDLNKSLALKNDDIDSTGFELHTYAWLGNREAVEEILRTYPSLSENSKASLCTVLGDYDEALKYIEKGFNDHTTCPSMISYDINFRNIRALPQYDKLVKSFKPMNLK